MAGVLDLVDKIICLDFFRKGDLCYEILSTFYPLLSFHQGHPKQLQQVFLPISVLSIKKIGFCIGVSLICSVSCCQGNIFLSWLNS